MIGLLLLFICLTLAGIGLYRAERALSLRRDAAGDAANELLSDVELRAAAELSPHSGDGSTLVARKPEGSSALREPVRGDGSRVGLPAGRADSGTESISDATAMSGDGLPDSPPEINRPQAGTEAPRSILIVDLDMKTRQRLREMLAGPYIMVEAENAQRAIELLERRLPSAAIVATNVRGRHGHAFWEWMRRSEATASVPVIVATSAAAGEELDERFQTSAFKPSGVLRKPLLIEEVRETVERVLDGRSAFGASADGWLPAIQSSDEDTRFVRRAQEEVEVQIANPAFGVRELSEELGLSARQLQRRLRETTGQSPNAFIRSIRLQHAVRLLERGSDPVSQVAYAVGFNSLSYFAKCFREHFGRNPSAFANKRVRSPFVEG